jgi:hypothetical protein
MAVPVVQMVILLFESLKPIMKTNPCGGLTDDEKKI